jgi:hypothetical protein
MCGGTEKTSCELDFDTITLLSFACELFFEKLFLSLEKKKYFVKIKKKENCDKRQEENK